MRRRRQTVDHLRLRFPPPSAAHGNGRPRACHALRAFRSFPEALGFLRQPLLQPANSQFEEYRNAFALHWWRTAFPRNPPDRTPLATLHEILPEVDLVLIMSVNPGFGGQSYIPASTDKISRLRKMLGEGGLTGVELEVDGGIKSHNAAEIVAAGASVLVIGSAIFNRKASIAANIAALREEIASLAH